MFPLLQLVLLLFTTLLFHIGTTNPNITNNTDYIPDEGIGVTFMTDFGPKIGKLMMWTITLCQVLYLYFQVFSPSLISVLFPQLSTFIDPLPWTFTSVLGYILMIVGGLGRLWCYKTLGKFFTYQITIRHSHKLIRTGPYAYVRHPSYTFAIILVIGMILVHRRLTNFFPTNEWIQMIISGPVAILINLIIAILPLIRRVIREEEELKKKFGKEWTQYASETKRFIPGLI